MSDREYKDEEEEEKKELEEHDSERVIVRLSPMKVEQEEDEEERGDAKDDEKETGGEQASPLESNPIIKLYKSSRLKGYITLVFFSFINYDSAQQSADTQNSNISVVPSTAEQRRYAISVAVVSLVLSSFCLLTHLDRITPLEKVWIILFKDGSKVEGILLALWSIWWAIGTGVTTSVAGIAGDGKGQYSLYYSSWICCLTTMWCLERWWVAAGWVSSGHRRRRVSSNEDNVLVC
jgi:hypothetical protein